MALRQDVAFGVTIGSRRIAVPITVDLLGGRLCDASKARLAGVATAPTDGSVEVALRLIPESGQIQRVYRRAGKVSVDPVEPQFPPSSSR